ncbi:MAG: hypothetical protein WD942_03795 [Dehalococcoidia bacterium]
MAPDQDPMNSVLLRLEAAWCHPMITIPFAHILRIEANGHISVTLRLWQWIDCRHGDEQLWLLRPAEEPGTTASGILAVALSRSYDLLESRWGADSPGTNYAASVQEALDAASYRAAAPPIHPYAIPRCGCVDDAY